MPPETSRSTTPTKRTNMTANYLAEAIIKDTNRPKNLSPPQTPPRRRKDPPSSYPKSARLAAVVGSTTFFDDTHGYDRDSATDEDGDDHHDLTYSSKHIPRASLVDHMVMALDQYSIASSEPKHYEEDLLSYRRRGHTFSSSISSESDVRTIQAQSLQMSAPKIMRRSSARYTRDPAKLPSIFGEDEENTRVRVYEAQRAAPPSTVRKPRNRGDDYKKKKSGGSASSVDLSQFKQVSGRLGPAGNRRSQSFDFGRHRHEVEHNEEAQDTAPHPVIYSGPKAQRTPASPPLLPTTLSRRDSMKSSKNIRSKSSNTLAASTVYENPLPPVPPTLTSTPSLNKLITTDEPQTASRPGLFKRFFGSSKSSVPGTPTAATTPQDSITYFGAQPATNKLHKQTLKETAEDHDKENVRPPLQKKPSSFFRRRKKSTTSIAVPPLPLTLTSSITGSEITPGQPSPVSSLKAFMDPYLTDDSKRNNRRSQISTSPLQTFYSPTEGFAGVELSQVESPMDIYSSQHNPARLSVPQKETFFTDNSSVEDGSNSAASDTDEPSKPVHSRTQPVALRTATAPAALPTTRPVLGPRSSSWHSEHLAIPPRSDSLSKNRQSRMISSTSPGPSKSVLSIHHRRTSGSETSEYRSAPSTPGVQNITSAKSNTSPRLHISHPSMNLDLNVVELDKAQDIYNNGEDDVDGRSAAAWLGEASSEHERVRKAYMQLFDWTGQTILQALRGLCKRLVLKAESQLIDRIFDAFARRWCDCNPNHGFKSEDVVHTLCYSILLLNTDLHMADIGSKMTRSQFVKNVMSTIRTVVAEASESSKSLLDTKTNSNSGRISVDRASSRAGSMLEHRPSDQTARIDSGDLKGEAKLLVDAPYTGSRMGWEMQIELVLKDFYLSIQREPLPLLGSDCVPRYPPSASNNNLLSLSGLRRTPSVLSKAQSDSNRSRYGDSKSLGSKWNTKGRSRPRLTSTPGFGSSKNSLEDQSSAWSPSMSSTWSKASLGKTLTSLSVDSFATSAGPGKGDFQSSIGFANALSQAIIREDQLETQTEDGTKSTPLLEDESLELEGAPWAKEGILKHKCHLDGVDKRSKDRNWNDCFAVIEKGWMRLFSFSVTAKSLRNRARSQKPSGVVGGGNWQENAEEVWKFMLRHTIASSLPPPGYSKQRPFVWALSLPTGAVHLFSVGTPDIVKEFVSTANFWSARLSKEPMIGGVSSMEYGWSDNVIDRAVTGPEVRPSFTSSDAATARPSTQMSMRSSIDHGGNTRPRLPGDRVHVSDWTPPQQSLLASQLLEVDQLKALQLYVQNIEEDLQRHNELRAPMLLAFSSKHTNYSRAMTNWEKKSAYLLREIVKFKNYIDALQGAQQTKERIYRLRQEDDRQRQADDDSMALQQSSNMGASPS